MNKHFINGKIIVFGFISKIIANVLNALPTSYLVKFENNLKNNILHRCLVVPPLLAKENKI